MSATLVICVGDFHRNFIVHDLSPFVPVTFMICVHNFPCGEVLVRVGVMEFGLLWLIEINLSLL